MSAFAVASVVGVPAGLYLGNKLDWHVPFLTLAALGTPFFIAAIVSCPPSASTSTRVRMPIPCNRSLQLSVRAITSVPSPWSSP